MKKELQDADAAQVRTLARHVAVLAWYASHGFTPEPDGPGLYMPFPAAGVFIRVVDADDVSRKPREVAAPVWATLHGTRDGRELAGFNAPDGQALLVRIARGDW